MYTVDMFARHETLGRFPRGKILTIEEAKQRTNTVIDHSFVGEVENVMFFSSVHSSFNGLLPECCVPATTTLPFSIVPRPGFENGRVETAEDYIRFLLQGFRRPRILETVEELVDYLNAQGYEPHPYNILTGTSHDH